MESVISIKTSRVHDGLRVVIAAEHHQEIGNHCRFSFFIQFHNLFLIQAVEGHLYHSHGAVHNPVSYTHLDVYKRQSFLCTTLVIEVPFLAKAFQFEHISLMEYGIAIGLALAIIPIMEVVKLIQRHSGK